MLQEDDPTKSTLTGTSFAEAVTSAQETYTGKTSLMQSPCSGKEIPYGKI